MAKLATKQPNLKLWIIWCARKHWNTSSCYTKNYPGQMSVLPLELQYVRGHTLWLNKRAISHLKTPTAVPFLFSCHSLSEERRGDGSEEEGGRHCHPVHHAPDHVSAIQAAGGRHVLLRLLPAVPRWVQAQPLGGSATATASTRTPSPHASWSAAQTPSATSWWGRPIRPTDHLTCIAALHLLYL